MKIESLLPPIKDHASKLLQEDPYREARFETNSFSNKELELELLSSIMVEVEDPILELHIDANRLLAMIDDKPIRSSGTSSTSLAGL